MSAINNSIQSVLSMIVIVSVGYVFAKKEWLSEKTAQNLISMITSVSIPCMMLNTMTSNFNKESLINSIQKLHIPVISIIITIVVGILYCKIFSIKRNKGLFMSMFFNSNTIFIGLPINMALFGEKSLPYVLVYFIGNTMFFWTLGVYEIASDNPKNKVLSFKSRLKNILSPPLLGFMVGAVLVLLDIRIPLFLSKSFKSLGDLTTPIAMLFVGRCVYNLDFKKVKFSREVVGVLIGRFILAPMVLMMTAVMFNLGGMARNVFFIQSAMPVMTTVAIMSKAYDVDEQYASIMVGLTTILSLVTIPIYIFILNYI